MKLKEFEAKQLLELVKVPCSKGVLITEVNDPMLNYFTEKCVVKVQSIEGKRAAKGGVQVVDGVDEVTSFCKQYLGSDFNGEQIDEILVDEFVEITREFFVAVTFDTSRKCPVLLFSTEGGSDIESVQRAATVKKIEINYLEGLDIFSIDSILEGVVLDKGQREVLKEIILRVYECFVRFDCKMLEVNPLVLDTAGNFIAVDASAVLDDDASFRSSVEFAARTGNRRATAREIAARKIDQDDHRGVAGKTFLDLDGDIAILTSGGGASMTLLDSLISAGGKPANFTEYSGNPPAEKVEALARIVLDKDDLSGLLVAGVVANFTDIYETVAAILKVLVEVKPLYPVVIRRVGPRSDEARELIHEIVEKHGLDIHYCDENVSLSQAALKMFELSTAYKQKNSSEVNV